MAIHSATVISSGKERPDLKLSSGQRVLNFHPEGSCFGEFCSVHKPSEHSMRDWPLAFTGAHMVRIVPGLRVSEGQGFLVPDYSDEPVPVVIDPDDYEFLRSGQAIIRNSGVCPHCGEQISSHHRHDYRECSCGKSMVDGGTSYLRRTVDLIDSSIVFYSLDEKKEI